MKLSVIVTSFNKGPYLAQALSSLNQQIRKPDEVILVDDGSTDTTPNFESHPVVSVYLRSNHRTSPGAAKNRGIRASTGDVIAFLDGDDWWSLEGFRSLLSGFSGNVDAVYGDYLDSLQPGTPTADWKLFRPEELTICSMICRREKIIQAGMFAEGLETSEDLALKIVLREIARVHYIGKLVYYYRRTPGSQTRPSEGRANFRENDIQAKIVARERLIKLGFPA